MTSKNSFKKKLKDLCVQEVGKSLGWISNLIQPYLPITLNYNSWYNEIDYFYGFLHMGLSCGSAESSSAILNLEHEVPSPDRILDKLKEIQKLDVIKENILYGTLSVAKKRGAFKQPVDIAIDPYDDPYYGNRNDIHVVGTKHKAGTNHAHSFVHSDIVVRGERFCIDFDKRTIFTKDVKIVEKLLRNAIEMVNIRIVMMDKEFYQVEIVNILYQYNLEFIIPAPDTTEVEKLKKLYKNKLPCVVEHTMTSGTGKQVRVKLALVERTNNKGKKQIHGFITNLNWDAEQVAEHYRNRWGIETNNKMRNLFKPWTTSQNYNLRFLYHLLSTTLHNIWVLVNLINTKLAYNIPYDPIIENYLLKEILISCLKPKLRKKPPSQGFVQFLEIVR